MSILDDLRNAASRSEQYKFNNKKTPLWKHTPLLTELHASLMSLTLTPAEKSFELASAIMLDHDNARRVARECQIEMRQLIEAGQRTEEMALDAIVAGVK